MAGNGSIGTYYIQIEPSTGGMAKTIGQELDGGKAGEKYGKSFIEAVKSTAIGTAIGSMISQGIQMALGGVKDAFIQAFQGFADYQQYVGGIEKLYGDASERMMQLAQEAYRTSGMSANQYMETATGLSASLINSLDGDVNAAAEMTDVAMRAMSDNVNTFGTDMSSVSAAYAGFARQNYTMLDNLKLGYAGSKQGMEQLIADANEYARSQGLAGDLVIDSFADQVRAIELIQEKQGIAGTTAKEAANTISGSLSMLGASWTNFLTELGNGNGDIEARISELVQSLGAAASNIIPTVISIAQNLIASIPDVVSQGFEAIRAAVIANAQTLEERFGAINFFSKLEEIVAPLRDQVLPVVQQVFGMIVEKVQQVAPQIMDLAANISRFLGAAFEKLSPVIYAVVDILGGALSAAIDVVSALFGGMADAINGVADVVGPVIDAILEGFEGLMEDLGPIFDTIGGFFTGIGEVIQDPLGALGDFVFGTESAADTVESSAREMSRAAKQGYGQVATQAKTSATTVANSAKTGTSSALNSIRTNMDAAVGVVRTDTQRMSAESAAQFQSIHSSASTQWNAVRDTIGQAMSKASGSVQSSASTIQQTINGIKGRTIDIKAQTNDVGGIANSVKSVLNSIQSKKTVEINAYKTGINGVKVQKNLIGGVLDAIKLVAFAQGGIVSSPTMAVIGEAGYSEAVVPLSPNGLRPFASALADQLDGGTRGVVINVQRMEVRKESDIRAVASALNNMVNRQNGGRL